MCEAREVPSLTAQATLLGGTGLSWYHAPTTATQDEAVGSLPVLTTNADSASYPTITALVGNAYVAWKVTTLDKATGVVIAESIQFAEGTVREVP